MENNYTPSTSLSEIVRKIKLEGDDSIKNNELYPREMDHTIQELLQKNTDLTTQLQKALDKISRLRKQRSALLDVIVKANCKNVSDDDQDSDLSAGDLHSDSDSSEDIGQEQQKRSVDPDEYNPKRRRMTKPNPNKRKNQRQQGKVRNAEPPKDENGNYIFPIELGATTILTLGKIIPHENFYTHNYIYPVGYVITRRFRSMVNLNEETVYTCTIEKEDNEDIKPVFCIEALDNPGEIIRKPTATAAWSEVLRRSNILRKNSGCKNSVSGPEYFGLSFNVTKKLIQQLPGAKECIGYEWIS